MGRHGAEEESEWQVHVLNVGPYTANYYVRCGEADSLLWHVWLPTIGDFIEKGGCKVCSHLSASEEVSLGG